MSRVPLGGCESLRRAEDEQVWTGAFQKGRVPSLVSACLPADASLPMGGQARQPQAERPKRSSGRPGRTILACLRGSALKTRDAWAGVATLSPRPR